MVDVVDAKTRSRMMSGIRGKDTKPELMIRKALHARGFRYRLHASELPGKPDLVFPRYQAAIFVHGCFWHRHDCSYFKMPGTRTEFWTEKIDGNVRRDAAALAALKKAGWRCLVVWECTLKKKDEALDSLVDEIVEWLQAGLSPESNCVTKNL